MKLATKNLVEATFKEDGILSKHFDGYSVRPQQVELSTKIRECFEKKQTLLGEAPTGVGKSLAALVPAFEHIMKTGKPVVVITSNIVLQEQYFYKDIPLLQEIFNFNVSPVLIKGRNNYLCNLKYAEFKATGIAPKASVEETEAILEWAPKTTTGDVNELPMVPGKETWNQFAVRNNHECLRKQCPLLNQCFYYRQRAKVASSKLIVCNYHYYFNAVNTPGMLPDEIGAIIMDEGHEVAAIARDFQEKKYGRYTLKNIMSGYAKSCQLVNHFPTRLPVDAMLADLDYTSINASLETMLIEISRVFMNAKPQGKDAWILETVQQKEIIDESIQYHIKELIRAEDVLTEYLVEDGLPEEERMYWSSSYPEEDVRLQMATESLVEQIQENRKWLEMFLSRAHDLIKKFEADSEVIRWVQGNQLNDDVMLVSKPTKAKGITQGIFADNKDVYKHMIVEGNTSYVPDNVPVVILSATLTVNAEFEHLKNDLGIDTNYDEINVTSPFDLSNNMLWYLPSDIPPGNSQEHAYFAFDYMKKVAETLGGRTLCLFTSNKNLVEGTNHLRRCLEGTGIDVISQQDLPKQKIIQKMKENSNVVVTATKSFFTGVDIQGQNLSAVLMDKLPFPMIGDPVNDHLMSKDHGFWSFSLPETIIALKQGFGRLNRTATDKGVVAVLDGRLSTARYKARIFNSFDFPVKATRTWEDVEDYLKQL